MSRLALITLLCLSCLTAATAFATDAVADDPSAHLVRISREPPPCAPVGGLPIVPNDPGALVTPGGTRCYGTRPAELELWLREDRYVWLERHAPNPAAWVKLGPVIVDPDELETPPLGLKLSAADGGGWVLETRYGDTATLTRLDSDGWEEVTGPDGQRFWVRLGGAERRVIARGDRVRTLRAD